MKWEELGEQFEIIIPPDEPVFPISIVCGLLHMHYHTLHEIIKEGLIEQSKPRKKKKLLSRNDLKRLKYIKHLMEERGVNIKGIKVIFEITE